MTQILTVDALTRRFGDPVAVSQVTLAIRAGEVFGLLGRNAAGKSTLIKMLTTLLPPSSGSATIAGYDILKQAARVRECIGYVPQSLSADGELTGRENLSVFANLYNIPRRLRAVRVREGLTFMGLGDAGDRLVSTYSGGMIRRLEIAQSMLHRPKILFLDEPTVGLDPVARDTVWEHIQQLRREFGMTIFLTTHYMDEAERLCGRVGIMQHGVLVVEGELPGLCSTLAKAELPAPTLADVFAFYTKDAQDEGNDIEGTYLETSNVRHTIQRLS